VGKCTSSNNNIKNLANLLIANSYLIEMYTYSYDQIKFQDLALRH